MSHVCFRTFLGGDVLQASLNQGGLRGRTPPGDVERAPDLAPVDASELELVVLDARQVCKEALERAQIGMAEVTLEGLDGRGQELLNRFVAKGLRQGGIRAKTR